MALGPFFPQMSLFSLLFLIASVVFSTPLTGCDSGPSTDPGTAESSSEARTGVAAARSAESATPPLIVLISFDTLRADHLGSYGYKRFTSPVLDILATESVLFEDASSTASWTLPSHASMLTGLYPKRHGVLRTDTKLPMHVKTLAEMLSREGFSTAAVVNMAFLNQHPFGVTRGFDQFELVPADPGRLGPATWVTDQAIEWIHQLGDQPAFLFMHYYDLHTTYGALPPFERLFVEPYEGKADGTAWQAYLANISDEFVERCRQGVKPERCDKGRGRPERIIGASAERIHFDEADMQHLIDLYDAGIRQLDAELDRFFSFLRENHLMDRCYLLFTADHGEEFGDHGSIDHSYTQYQEMLRVPILIRGPGIPAGLRISTPVSLVDLVPTILGLAQITPSVELDGLDLAPLWRAARASEPGAEPHAAIRQAFLQREVYSEAHFPRGLEAHAPPKASVRRGYYKLHYSLRDDGYELYDLAADPYEQEEVSAKHPKITQELLDIIRQRHRDASPDGEVIELDDGVREQLQVLGYMD
jgi:arylsulfatase A-like enzyme